MIGLPKEGPCKGVSQACIEKSLTNNGGKAVDCWSEETVGKDTR